VAPPTTYHLVPSLEWSDGDAPYVPTAFDRDGFVHCTDGAAEVAATANRYYADADDLLVLTIDRARLQALVRYEDPRQVYPHVYGPIERDAILKVEPMRRDAVSGAWMAPA
jgi:uncharacterized protein (DUF952 family)